MTVANKLYYKFYEKLNDLHNSLRIFIYKIVKITPKAQQ
jgi:hypothetical protein